MFQSSRASWVTDWFYGPGGVYWDRIALVGFAAGAFVLAIYGYESFVSGPAARREEGARLARKSLPEITIYLLRNKDGHLPADLSSQLAAARLSADAVSQVQTIAPIFGYSDPLFLNELSKRAELMTPATKEMLVDAVVRIAQSTGRAEARENARRLIKNLGRLSARSIAQAKEALSAAD